MRHYFGQFNRNGYSIYENGKQDANPVYQAGNCRYDSAQFLPPGEPGTMDIASIEQYCEITGRDLVKEHGGVWDGCERIEDYEIEWAEGEETIWCENGCCETEGIVTRTKQDGSKMRLCSLCADAWDMGAVNEPPQGKEFVNSQLVNACKYVVQWHRDHDSGEGELFGLDFVTTCIAAIAQVEKEANKPPQGGIMQKTIEKILRAWRPTELTEAQRQQEIVDELVAEMAIEIEDATGNALWEDEKDRMQDNLWASRTTGTPDMFADELRAFWDNGRPGNV